MNRERLKHPTLPEAFSEVLSDVAELFRKELRLAKAELASNVSTKLRGGIWLAIAGLLGLAAFALVLGSLVSWVATLDISLPAAFLIVAAGVGLAAILTYLAGRKDADKALAPSRTIRQVKQDIDITKEQLT
jgi:hypothetical protein